MDRSAQLDKLAKNIKSAPDLYDLHSTLVAFEEAADINADGYDGHRDNDIENDLKARGIDICELPTFGGEWPKSTEGVWSWNEDQILAGEGPFKDWEIRDRT